MILHTKRQRSFFFSSSIVFGWTGWTGWTGTEKSGTSCVQPKILTLDRLDRRDDPPQREPRSYARWLVVTATVIMVVVTAAVTNAGLALDDPPRRCPPTSVNVRQCPEQPLTPFQPSPSADSSLYIIKSLGHISTETDVSPQTSRQADQPGCALRVAH